MYLIIFEDDVSYQTDNLSVDIMKGLNDGLVSIFKVEAGAFYEMIKDEEWVLVQESY